MNKISVVMLTYNAASYLAEAIESVLRQSFEDFEFIIVDDGSEDDTLAIVRAYTDMRIRLIESGHDTIGSLNLAIQMASGKYIAYMDASHRMHIDRLRIQYTIMEEEPEITVCSSWVSFFGEKIYKRTTCSIWGTLEHPLLYFLKGNAVLRPSVMLRTDFLRCYSLRYMPYDCVEDYKLWVEIAKLGGVFYIEPQPLVYYRVLSEQAVERMKEVETKTSNRIRREVLNYLIDLNRTTHPSCAGLLASLEQAEKEKLLDEEEIFRFFYRIFGGKYLIKISFY